MKDFSYITNSSPAFIENLYRDFVNNPESVDPDLKKFFEGFDFAMANAANRKVKWITECQKSPEKSSRICFFEGISGC